MSHIQDIFTKSAEMYDKETLKALRTRFWTCFGIYMRQYHSALPGKVSWVNYRTGVKHVYFRAQADKRGCSVAIVLEHPDPEIRALFYEQFEELQLLLESNSDAEWTWMALAHDEYGKEMAMIRSSLPGLSMFREEDWAGMYAFMGQRLVELDELWSMARETFLDLQS